MKPLVILLLFTLAVSVSAQPGQSLNKPKEQTALRGKFQLEGEHWTYTEGDFTLNGILLKPAGKGPFPAVLISHGLGGSAESFGMMKAREMVRWGCVCIAPDYTHSSKAMGGRPGGKGGTHGAVPNAGASTENIRRAQTCLDLLKAMPEVDASRMAAYGHSMGGFVTIALAASQATLKAAAITGSGISPQEGYAAPSTKVAEAIRTPFLMLHGGNDTVVRPEQSAALKQVLDRHKVPNDRLVADGQGHPVDQTMREEVFRLVREWFTKYGVLDSATK